MVPSTKCLICISVHALSFQLEYSLFESKEKGSKMKMKAFMLHFNTLRKTFHLHYLIFNNVLNVTGLLNKSQKKKV